MKRDPRRQGDLCQPVLCSRNTSRVNIRVIAFGRFRVLSLIARPLYNNEASLEITGSA